MRRHPPRSFGRTVGRTIGAPVRALEIALIRLYRATLSGWLGGQCRFYPSCSHYAEDAVRGSGAVKGSALAAWRVLRCNPFGSGGVDPAPKGAEYESVIPRDSVSGVEA